jgi:peptide deformylase
MSLAEIVRYPDEILSKPTRTVEKFDSGLASLVKRLIQIMIDAPGIGVAANQIGIDLSVAVIGIPSTKQPLILVNPEILKASKLLQVSEEGCLSLPGYWGRPMRSERIRVEYQDPSGQVQRLDASEYLAQVIQHETDHLNGFVYVQRLPEGESLNVIEAHSHSQDDD